MELQVFRRRNKVVCVKAGWIAVDIPYEWKIHQVELRGISTASEDQGGGVLLGHSFGWDVYSAHNEAFSLSDLCGFLLGITSVLGSNIMGLLHTSMIL